MCTYDSLCFRVCYSDIALKRFGNSPVVNYILNQSWAKYFKSQVHAI